MGAFLARLVLWAAAYVSPDVFRDDLKPIDLKAPQPFWRGYRDEKGKFLPGHFFASVVLATTLALYVIGYFVLKPGPGEPWLRIPALTYLLLLLILGGWLLTGLSFFLDRYRVPAVLLLLVFSFLFYTVSDTDHYFPLEQSPDPALTLEQVINDWEDHQVFERNPVMVVVAASGGGITAAMWTACVLTGL